MSILYQNILYTVLLIISSIVITIFLSRFKMKMARTLFIILSIIMSLYIPFYFGGNTMISLFTNIFNDAVYDISVIPYRKERGRSHRVTQESLIKE